MPESKKILCIEQDGSVTRKLQEVLVDKAGYAVSFDANPDTALSVFKDNQFDLVIAPFVIGGLDGLELIKRFKAVDPDCVIILSEKNGHARLLEDSRLLGAYDTISNDSTPERLLSVVAKGLELHAILADSRKFAAILKEQNAALQKQNLLLAKRIDESTRNLTRLYEDLRSTYMRTIKALAQAIDARDHYTHSHSENVANIAVVIAQEMGLSARDLEHVRQASELHDLGKIGIEDRILTKPSGLDAEEWEQIKRHPQMGAQILEPLTFLNDVIELVRQHHEHYDGSGYPKGLKGEGILLGAQIIHLADAYETMRSERAYRKVPLSKQEAIAEVKRNSGTQFSPRVVEAFLKVVDTL
ncbi:MAG: HD domain-containing phosphohydrolase [Candidatus Omnitrophota bacterium]